MNERSKCVERFDVVHLLHLDLLCIEQVLLLFRDSHFLPLGGLVDLQNRTNPRTLIQLSTLKIMFQRPYHLGMEYHLETVKIRYWKIKSLPGSALNCKSITTTSK